MLREARMRAHIDISEIESETKIRAKYLRALENEEWNLLPGPTFVKSFLRTYAEALGLDAKLIVEEFKLRHERPSEFDLQPIRATGLGRERRPSPRPRVPRWVIGLLLAVGAADRAVHPGHGRSDAAGAEAAGAGHGVEPDANDRQDGHDAGDDEPRAEEGSGSSRCESSRPARSTCA